MKRILLISFAAIAIGACNSGSKKAADRSASGAVRQFEIKEAWRTDTILMTPESVILDRKRNVFYITNLNFEPRKKDGNGFISRADRDGKIIELKWFKLSQRHGHNRRHTLCCGCG